MGYVTISVLGGLCYYFSLIGLQTLSLIVGDHFHTQSPSYMQSRRVPGMRICR